MIASPGTQSMQIPRGNWSEDAGSAVDVFDGEGAGRQRAAPVAAGHLSLSSARTAEFGAGRSLCGFTRVALPLGSVEPSLDA